MRVARARYCGVEQDRHVTGLRELMIPAALEASQNNLKVIALRLSEQAGKQHIQGVRREA